MAVFVVKSIVFFLQAGHLLLTVCNELVLELGRPSKCNEIERETLKPFCFLQIPLC